MKLFILIIAAFCLFNPQAGEMTGLFRETIASSRPPIQFIRCQKELNKIIVRDAQSFSLYVQFGCDTEIHGAVVFERGFLVNGALTVYGDVTVLGDLQVHGTITVFGDLKAEKIKSGLTPNKPKY